MESIKLAGSLFLALMLILSGVSASCSAGATTTCTCPNGKVEKYISNSDDLREAIKDPKSCCYSGNKPSIKAYPSISSGGLARASPEAVLIPVKAEEVIPEIMPVMPVKTVLESVEIGFTQEIVAAEPIMDDLYSQAEGMLRALFLSVFLPPLRS